MVREFRLPDVGEGLTEAEILEWYVEPGDPVSEDQVVAEVETDKAVVEVPSPVNGTVKELRADPGDVVAVGEVIITFDVEGETDEDEADETVTQDPQTTTESDSDMEGEGRVFAAPSARRLARERGVDLATVSGSGPGGRITMDDVRAAAAEHATEAEPHHPSSDGQDGSVEAAATPRGDTPRERTLAAPASRGLARELDVDLDVIPAVEEREGQAFVTAEAVRSFAESSGTEPAAQPHDRVERVPYRGVRRAVGEQMERAVYTAPHVTHHDEVDATALVTLRGQLREAAEDAGVSLTYLPFVIRAVLAALEEYPYLNAELDEDAEEILLKRYYNVGVATATDAGLVVPVIEDADQLSLLDLARRIGELTDRARDRSITREEMQGGTFTITNFGAIGGEYATPIINYPEVAILGLGAITEKPRVHDGEIVPRQILPLSLSIDHRVVDGAVAAGFVNEIKRQLETPARLLLE